MLSSDGMVAWVYILQSLRNERYYIGHTLDLQRRLSDHNAGLVKATRYLRPWRIVYREQHETPTAARKREWYLKRLKSRKAVDELIARKSVDQTEGPLLA